MRDEGLVDTRTNADDARITDVLVTPKGDELTDRIQDATQKIYVRGYAMTANERDETTADPFCGFNSGSTVYRAVPDRTRRPPHGKVTSIYESQGRTSCHRASLLLGPVSRAAGTQRAQLPGGELAARQPRARGGTPRRLRNPGAAERAAQNA